MCVVVTFDMNIGDDLVQFAKSATEVVYVGARPMIDDWHTHVSDEFVFVEGSFGLPCPALQQDRSLPRHGELQHYKRNISQHHHTANPRRESPTEPDRRSKRDRASP